MRKLLKLIAALTLLFTPAAWGACHTVSPTGSGAATGADWNNSLPGSALGGTSLVRGDAYFMADGTYTNTTFQQPISGVLQITVNKATAAAHCTDTGWNTGTMGSSVAGFGFGSNTILSFTTSHWALNGLTAAAGNCNGFGCGILLDWHISDCTASQCFYFRNFPLFTANLTDITIQGVEEIGHGTLTDTHYDEGFYFFSDTTLVFKNNYILNSSGTPFEFGGNNGYIVDHNLIDTTHSTATNHAGGLQDQGSSNAQISNNKWKDIGGTSVLTDLCRSTCGQTANKWQIFGNVFYSSGVGAVGDGIVACINSEVCTNWAIYNNDTVGYTVSSAGIICSPCISGNSFSIKNNIWYKNSASMVIPAGTGVTVTENNNSFIFNSFSNGFVAMGANDVTSGVDPGAALFINPSVLNFNLGSQNASWTAPDSLAFAIPNNADPNGTARSTDRGAYEIVSGPVISLAPAPQLTFGNVVQGIATPATETVSNVGGSAFTLGSAPHYYTITGVNAGDFGVTSGSLSDGGTLNASSSGTSIVTFTPAVCAVQAGCPETATFTIAGSSASVTLSGVGLPIPVQPAPSTPAIVIGGGFSFDITVTNCPVKCTIHLVCSSGCPVLTGTVQ